MKRLKPELLAQQKSFGHNENSPILFSKHNALKAVSDHASGEINMDIVGPFSGIISEDAAYTSLVCLYVTLNCGIVLKSKHSGLLYERVGLETGTIFEEVSYI